MRRGRQGGAGYPAGMVSLQKDPRGTSTFVPTPELVEALRAQGYYLGQLPKGERRYHLAEDTRLAKQAVVMRGRDLPSMGAYSYSYSGLRVGTRVGAYSSIASGMRVMGDAHPMERFTTSPITYDGRFPIFRDAMEGEPFTQVHYAKKSVPPVIGSDVWIAGDALLAGGVTIGTGSIVAARAVVTKDVPPYAVVGGVPARTIRLRFSESTIERLLASEWWTYDIPSLRLNADAGVDEFLDALGEQAEAGTVRRLPEPELFRTVLENIHLPAAAPPPSPPAHPARRVLAAVRTRLRGAR
jgi:virginiamycin A acetyltransferase